MFKRSIRFAVLGAMTASTALVQAQTIDSLQRSAKVYADTDWAGTYLRLCIPTGGSPHHSNEQSRQFPERGAA